MIFKQKRGLEKETVHGIWGALAGAGASLLGQKNADAAAATPSQFTKTQESKLTPEQEAAYKGLISPPTRPESKYDAAGNEIMSSDELAAAQAEWDKKYAAPKIGDAQHVADITQSTIADTSLRGLDEAVTSEITGRSDKARETLGKAEDLYGRLAETSIQNEQDQVLEGKIKEIMDKFGAEKVLGARELQAYGSDSANLLSKINIGRTGEIAKAVAESGLDAKKFDIGVGLEAAQGITGVGASRGNIATSESKNLTDLIATQGQIDKDINVRQAELDQERKKINADLQSANADRVLAAQAKNAELEASQRRLDLDKIAQVEAVENIVVEGEIVDEVTRPEEKHVLDQLFDPLDVGADPFTRYSPF